jgi:hypothetical protein
MEDASKSSSLKKRPIAMLRQHTVIRSMSGLTGVYVQMLISSFGMYLSIDLLFLHVAFCNTVMA